MTWLMTLHGAAWAWPRKYPVRSSCLAQVHANVKSPTHLSLNKCPKVSLTIIDYRYPCPVQSNRHNRGRTIFQLSFYNLMVSLNLAMSHRYRDIIGRCLTVTGRYCRPTYHPIQSFSQTIEIKTLKNVIFIFLFVLVTISMKRNYDV